MKRYCVNCKYMDRFSDVGWCKIRAHKDDCTDYIGRKHIKYGLYEDRAAKNRNGDCEDYSRQWFRFWVQDDK